MIKPGEFQKRANAAGVRDTQIEKDYMLTWVLQGIANNGVLSKHLVFKGGTVLKKAYFEDYRFSEDLDFTLLDDTIENETIFQAFGEVFDYIREEANIPLEIIKDHEHQSGSINFYIGYTGPLGGLGINKRLKVDITRGETLEFEVLEKKLFSEYSDSDEFVFLCYSLEEILIEKMCALMGRTQSRDYYDLWYLLEIEGMDLEYFWPEFERKAANKNHNPKELSAKLEKKLNVFKGRWLLFMLKGIEETARETIIQINEINNALQQTIETVKDKAQNVYSKELIELLFEHPYSKIEFLEDRRIAKRKAAGRYLHELEAL